METGANRIEIQASTFNISLSKEYHLSIELSLNNFSFCILDINKLSYQYFKTEEFNSNSIKKSTDNIIEIINKNPTIQSEFSSLSVAYNGFPNTLIPSSIYDESYEEKVLNLNTKHFNNILRDNIHSQETKLIYSVPKQITSIIDSFFPQAKCNAQESILINQYSKLQEIQEIAYIDICLNKVMITILKSGKLILNNSFNFSTKEDLLYYILFCFEQLKLSTESIRVKLFGEIKKNDENYNILYEYIRNISFGENVQNIIFPDKFRRLEKHQYYGLFSQVLCA